MSSSSQPKEPPRRQQRSNGGNPLQDAASGGVANSPKKNKAPAKPVRDTPMIRQYLELKEQADDCILFFRMGDFYEMFFNDAVIASRVLSIALTSRDKGHPDPIPMCGVPHRAVDSYLAKMVNAGYKVAVCDQVEDPKLAKGLVKRDITRIITPSMFTDPDHLDAASHRFLAAVCLDKNQVGLAVLELASGEFLATVLPSPVALADELSRLEAAELVMAESQAASPLISELPSSVSRLPRSIYSGRPPSLAQAEAILEGRMPEGEVDSHGPALRAAAMAWSTVQATQRCSTEHIEPLHIYQVASHLVLDATARRNLELYSSIAEGGRRGSLLYAVDHTATPMGARLLHQWLGFPLLKLKAVEARHQAVEELANRPARREELAEALSKLPDLPRLVGRVSMGRAGPRDLAGLRDCLALLPDLAATAEDMAAPLLGRAREKLLGLEDLAQLLADTLAQDPPISLVDGGVIAEGVDEQLDYQRSLNQGGKDWIAGLQASLRADNDIPSLKVGYNRVFGYYIEVTKTHQDKVPEHFIRKQTLAAAERYFTPELKDKEAAVLGAEEKALELERIAFENLRKQAAARSEGLMACARALAEIDVLSGLAELAVSSDYVRPVMSEDGPLIIEGGRHPVVEQMLGEGEFVPNDLKLDMEEQQVIIITGPNMAGKSTILRQTALIVLLAQAGSFVPASSARLPMVDRIFTRVGAMDDLARGRSTFMVEMTETSQILAQATERSLVILDEVGRGTSTFDGLSLAWAVAEHLHDQQGRGVKTLFATHYHELTDMANTHSRVRNFNVSVKEFAGRIVFLRRLKPGGVSRSYGLAVARLAGLPEEVLARAQDILTRLEAGESPAPSVQDDRPSSAQLGLFEPAEHPVLSRLKELDPDAMTPIEALAILDELKRGLS